MTLALESRADGRLGVASLDSLTSVEAMDLLRGHKIQHLVWVGPIDKGLTTFAGNFGMTFQVGDGLMLRDAPLKTILVIG